MAIPYGLKDGTVLALWPESDAEHPVTPPAHGTRVLAPIYNPRRYVKHWPATVLSVRTGAAGSRVIVAYDAGHDVNHYGPVYRGDVFVVDLLVLPSLD